MIDAEVVLEPITVGNRPALDNLFELYVYDFSEHMPLRIQRSGRFELTPGDAWGTRGDHFGYLIQGGEELAGFALVRAGSRVTSSPDVMDIAEFFILRGRRRSGLGTRAAHALFAKFDRPWEVRVRRTNAVALQFWSRVAEAWSRQPLAIQPFRADGVDWDVLRFGPSRG